MSDSDKTLWWNMHKKSSYKLYAGDGKLFPFTMFTIIFDVVSNGIYIHANNTMVADSDTVSVLTEVINDRLCTIEGFLTMGNPVFFVAGVEKLFEVITVAILFATTMKFKLVILIQRFKLIQIFTTEYLR